MSFSLRPPKAGQFGQHTTITDDFILFGYEADRDEYLINLVGTRSTKRTLVVYRMNKETQTLTYTLMYEMDVPFEIHFVVTGVVNENDENAYILVEKRESGFNLHYADINEKKPVLLTETDIMPALVLGKNHERRFIVRTADGPALLQIEPQSGTKHQILDFHMPRLEHLSADTVNDVQAMHSSAFIDLDGDGHPDLVLDTFSSNQRIILVFLTTDSGKTPNKIILRKESGPLVFSDFDHDGQTDVCVVETSASDGPVLRIIHNSFKESKQVFSDKPRETITRLANINSKYEPITVIENLGLQGGIFVHSLELRKSPSICLIVRNTSTNREELLILSPDIESDKTFFFSTSKEETNSLSFSQSKYSSTLDFSDSPIISVSGLDPDRKGREGLILNTIKDGKYHLYYYENNLEIDNNKLSFITLDNNSTSDMLFRNKPLPGVSYTIMVDKHKIIRHQMEQTSFLNLKNPLITFGLGSLNLLVDNISISIPYKQIHPLHRKVIPNSDLLLNYRNNTLSVELLLKYSFYIYFVFITLAVVLIINFVVVLFFTYKETKKRRKEKRKEAIAFNFNAL